MRKSNTTRYTADQREHYKMYKQGKMWTFALISTFAIGVGGLTFAQQNVHADTANAAVVASSASTPSSAAAHNNVVVVTSSAGVSATSSAQSTATSNATSQESTASAQPAASTATSSANVSLAPTRVTSSVASSATVASQATRAASVTPQGSSVATSSAATQTLVDPTSAELSAAKSSAAATYHATQVPQQVNAVAGDAQNTSLKISTDKVGVGAGFTESNGDFNIQLTINDAAVGDVYTVTVPANGSAFQYNSVNTLDSLNLGTTKVVKNADGSRTITDTFSAIGPGVNIQTINMTAINNYTAQSTPIQDVGTTTETVTYTVNGVARTPVTFTQTVQPAANMAPVATNNPNDANASTPLISNTNYVFTLNIGENDGVMDTTSYKAAQVNSAVNYGGTVVHVPVPADFELNADNTKLLNNMSTGTTITQPDGAGTDVIITVPAGGGAQNYQDKPAYRIAGMFTKTFTGDAQSFTATGPATMRQVIDSKGTVYTADNGTPWMVTLLGTGPVMPLETGTISIGGNSNAANTQLVLDNDRTNDPTYLAQINFANNSVQSVTDAHFVITIPDGITATGVRVPDKEVSAWNYLPDALTYSYTATLADGTVETGTIAGGGTITSASGKAIRKVDIHVDHLAAGAALTTTGDITKTNTFSILGSLASTYDNGNAVVNGDKLDFTAALLFGDQDVTGKSVKVTETVASAFARIGAFVYQNSQQPGQKNAGVLSLVMPGGYAHTTEYIYEPIFYYVLPTATTYFGLNNVDPRAKVTRFTASDGRTVVEIDYTGTGIAVQTFTYNVSVQLSNNADALPGKYNYQMYIYSPTTALQSGLSKTTNTSYTNGNANALLFANDNWTINALSVFTSYSFAQGNENQEPLVDATADAYGDDDASFYVSMVNTTDDTGQYKATVVANLPALGDDQGSGYTFQLTGPVVVPTNFTTATGTGAAIDATVRYSTQRAAMADNQLGFDVTGYMTADQLMAAGYTWTDVKSVMITVNNITNVASTGRIQFPGKVINMPDYLNKVGYLQTGLSINDGKTSVSGSKQGGASLTIESHSTITARLHYVDSNGADQYVELPDLTQSLRDGVDKVAAFPTTLAGLSAADQALVPRDFVLKGTSLLAADGHAGTAATGAVATHTFDGNVFQYDLQGTATATVTFVNNDTGDVISTRDFNGTAGDVITLNKAIIPAADTTLAPLGWVGTPIRNDYINTDAGKTYTLTGDPTQPQSYTIYLSPLHQVNIQYVDNDNNGAQVGELTVMTGIAGVVVHWTAKVPANYTLIPGQFADGSFIYKTAHNNNVVVRLMHLLKHDVVTTTRTIHYVVHGGGVTAPTAVSQTVTWNTDTDLVTNTTVATPQDIFADVQTPHIASTSDGTTLTEWATDTMMVAGIAAPPQMGMPTDPADVTVTYYPAKLDVKGIQTWTKAQVGEPVFSYPAGMLSDGIHVWTKTQVGEPVFSYPEGMLSDGIHVWTKAQVGEPVFSYPEGMLSDGIHVWSKAQVGEPVFSYPKGMLSDGIHVWTKAQVGEPVFSYPKGMLSDGIHVWTKAQVGEPVFSYPEGMLSDGIHVWTKTQVGEPVFSYPEGMLSDGIHVWTKSQVGEPVFSYPKGMLSDGIHVWTKAQVGEPVFTYPHNNGGGDSGQPATPVGPDRTPRLPQTGGDTGTNTPTTPRQPQAGSNGTARTIAMTGNPDTAATQLPQTGGVVGGATATTSRALPNTGSRRHGMLPQTSDQQNVLAVVGIALLTGMLGLFGIKRRRRD